jgi:hypothetical protein
MIFFHKPYYNFNYTNPHKEVLVIYALNPKNYTKYTNYIMKKKKHRKKFKNQIKKNLNLKKLLTEKKKI